METIPIKIAAIPSEIAEVVRSTRKSPGYGHPVYIGVAKGYGPCRHCLNPFKQGAEERALFTYDAFGGGEEVPLPGPVYIHAGKCERYPEDGGYPDALRQFASVIHAYGHEQRLIAQVHVDDGSQPEAIQGLLALHDVRYLHVRDRKAGCFDFRVERAL